MNILFDFITLHQYTGAGEYVRRVFYEVLKQKEKLELNIFGLFDSKKGIAYSDIKNISNITLVDINKDNINTIIKKYNINRFFIGCAQYIGKYEGIDKIGCEVICTTHDLCDEEFYSNKISTYLRLSSLDAELPIKQTLKDRIRTFFFPNMHLDNFSKWYISFGGNKIYKSHQNRMPPIIQLFHNNPKMEFIVVSEYTKSSMIYNYNIPSEKIRVLYSPERISYSEDSLCCDVLKKIIIEGKKYFLFVSANRKVKNIDKTINAFRKYAEIHPESYLVTIGYNGSKQFNNHIILSFLSDNDLELAYKHCYALLYPSFFEGFGYPPLEAMRYGKPVLCSNTTSLPEIFGDAPIYFSPLYESAIFQALTKLCKNNYEYFSNKSLLQYQIIHDRQGKDLDSLIKFLVRENI